MRLLNRILTAILALAAVIGVAAALGPATGRYRATTALSGSMRPTIDPGDVIVSVPVDAEDVRVGDVVTFERPDGSGNVTHRVVAIDREDGEVHVTTKGDANESVDRFDVRFVGRTAWRTVGVVPKAGHAFVAARTLLDQPLYLPIIGLLLAVSLCWTIWRPRHEESHDAAAA